MKDYTFDDEKDMIPVDDEILEDDDIEDDLSNDTGEDTEIDSDSSDSNGTYPYSMGELDENHIEFFKYSDTATVYFTKRKYINRVKKLKEQHPDDVEIQNETSSDILAKVPVGWIRIAPPRQVNLTDEQKKELSDRLKQAREK